MKEFEVFEVPKNCKISYFFTSSFLGTVLQCFLGIGESSKIGDHESNVENFTDLSSIFSNKNKPVNFIKEIQNTKKSTVEKFLNIVSLEFNKNLTKEDRRSKEQVENGEEVEMVKIPEIEVLNNFLSLIDIEILTAWKSEEYNGVGMEFEKTGKKILDGAQNLFWGNHANNNNNSNFADEDDITLKYDTVRTRNMRILQSNTCLINKKVSSKLSELQVEDVVDLLNQLYIFLSILLCIGIIGKRSSWCITQINFLDENSKNEIKKWCLKEKYMDVFGVKIDLKGNIEISTGSSLNIGSSNLNSVLGNAAGWMNVSGSTDDEKLIKLEKKFEEVENANEELVSKNEELKIKIEGLYDAVNNLTVEKERERVEKEAFVEDFKVEKSKMERTFAVEKELLEQRIKELEVNVEESILNDYLSDSVSGGVQNNEKNVDVMQTDDATKKYDDNGEFEQRLAIEIKQIREEICNEYTDKMLVHVMELQNTCDDLSNQVKQFERENKDLVVEKQCLELQLEDAKRDKELIISRLESEKLHYKEIIEYLKKENENKGKKDEKDEKTKEEGSVKCEKILHDESNDSNKKSGFVQENGISAKGVAGIIKVIIKRQREYERVMNDFKNDIIYISSKYKLLKHFTFEMKKKNEYYENLIETMVEKDKKIWSFIVRFKILVNEIFEQIEKIKNRGIEPMEGWVEEVTIISKCMGLAILSIDEIIECDVGFNYEEFSKGFVVVEQEGEEDEGISLETRIIK